MFCSAPLARLNPSQLGAKVAPLPIVPAHTLSKTPNGIHMIHLPTNPMSVGRANPMNCGQRNSMQFFLRGGLTVFHLTTWNIGTLEQLFLHRRQRSLKILFKFHLGDILSSNISSMECASISKMRPAQTAWSH